MRRLEAAGLRLVRHIMGLLAGSVSLLDTGKTAGYFQS